MLIFRIVQKCLPAKSLESCRRMLLLGFKVEEIPAVMHKRQTGVSMHSGLKPVIYMFRMVFSIIGVVFRVKVLKIDAGAGNEDVFLEEQK